MEESVSRQFGIYLVFWIAYFAVVYSGCLWAYFRLLGRPPETGGTQAMAAWEEKERGLRRRFYRIGAALMLVPLLWPFIHRLIR
jgi:hypothetical protein